jgi:hypothetical protein
MDARDGAPEGQLPAAVKRGRNSQWLIALGVIIIASAAFVILFERIPIEGTSLGIDWHSIWSGMNRGRPLYGSWMVTPPWIILAILPLAFISFQASWGIVLLITMGAVILSIPRTQNRIAFTLMALLMGTAFSHLRHAADGNLEGLIILGVLAILWAFGRGDPYAMAVGIFLASAKVQVTWLLLLFVLGSMVVRWPWRRWLITLGLVGASIGIGLIWRGREWVQTLWVVRELSQPVDISLWAAAPRLGLPSWLAILIALVVLAISVGAMRSGRWSVSREKAGVLVSASLLVAPYAAGNSLLSSLVVGGAPLLLASPALGIATFVLDDLKYLSPNAWMVAWGPTYATGQNLLLWTFLVWWILRRTSAQVRPSVDDEGVERGEPRAAKS